MKAITNRSAGALGLPPSYNMASVVITYRAVDEADVKSRVADRALCALCGRQMRGEKHPVGVRIAITVASNPSMDLVTRGMVHPLCAPLDWASEMLGERNNSLVYSDSPILRFLAHKSLRDYIAAQVGKGGVGEGRPKDAFDNGIK